jgi:hypothetical protein
VQAYYNVRSDDATALGRWQARVQLAFLFPAGKPKPKSTTPESANPTALPMPAAAAGPSVQR